MGEVLFTEVQTVILCIVIWYVTDDDGLKH